MGSLIEAAAGERSHRAAGMTTGRAAPAAEPREAGRYLCAAGGGPGRGANPFKREADSLEREASTQSSGAPDPCGSDPESRGLQLEFPELFGNQAERPPPGAE
jgi:hypothetical protein